MNQELENLTTNYLSPNLFYNKFLFWLVRLDPFVSNHSPMLANHFVTAFRIQYGSGLRITEVLNLQKEDLDLDHRILTIKKAKTGRNQKTTILPYDISVLEKFTENMKSDQKLFSIDRSTMWKYAKNAGKLAGLNIFESQTYRDITGLWTHLLRKSCSKRMQKLGASRELRMLKLRHSNKDAHDTYDRPDLTALLIWEAQHMNTKVSNS